MTPVQHLLAWFTPARRQLINCSAVDRLAHQKHNRFSRFLAQPYTEKKEKFKLIPYYPVLQLLGYLPTGDIWVPERSLTPAESSTDIREWMTEERRQLINFRQVDEVGERPLGVFSRYLNEEEHLTFKIIGIEVYYPTLMLLGFVPVAKDMTNSATDFQTAAEHLLSWFTLDRRRFINSLALDRAAGQQEGTLSEFLAGYLAARERLAEVGLQSYYPALKVLGYTPEMDLTKDESGRCA